MKGAPTVVLQDLSTPVAPRSAGWRRLHATEDAQAKVTFPSHMADQSPAPMGSGLLPTHRFREQSSPFPAELFQEALVPLMRRPEAALAHVLAGAHVPPWERRGTQLGGDPKSKEKGHCSPGLTPPTKT